MAAASATVDGIARVPLERTFDLATPLTPVGFYPKFGPLPATIEVRDQTGPWDAPGQTRQLILSDGGYVIEHLKLVERPSRFSYELTDFQKLFGKLVSGARAQWEFTAVPGGTRIRWTYTFHPFPQPVARVVVGAIVKLFWGPYMKKVLPGIINEVESRA
jgi:hypothetical protein